MKGVKTFLLFFAVVIASLAQSGCTFFALSGGGPLSRDELGNWTGIKEKPLSDVAALQTLVNELKSISHNPFAGKYSYSGNVPGSFLSFGDIREFPFLPTRGLALKAKQNGWLYLVPCKRHSDFLFYQPAVKSSREIYATKDGWGIGIPLTFDLYGEEQANAYDVSTRVRVASQKVNSLLLYLGWGRIRRVIPVSEEGKSGLYAIADSTIDLSEVRYNIKDGNVILWGLFGWGRVNYKRYIQILWIPIPLGRIE